MDHCSQRAADRRTAYSLSDPYYTDYASVMVETSSLIDGMEDLPGCTVGVRFVGYDS